MKLDPYVWLVGALVCGCNSDDLEQWVFSTSGSTEVDPTEVPVFTTGEPEETTGPGVPPPTEETCRGALLCAAGCALEFGGDGGTEGEWQLCFEECFADLNYIEWLLLFDLLECVVPLCSMTPECMTGDDTCNACYVGALGAVEPNLPMGCEAEALACD